MAIDAGSKDARIAPSFLVLMATCNGERWIAQQLDSVMRQQEVLLQVRISDDASSDRTAQLVRQAAADDQRITLLADQSSTGSASANFFRLIRSVDGDSDKNFTHVALCDQDDVWYPDKLRCAAIKMNETGAALYSSAVNAQWSSGKAKILTQCAIPTDADFLFEGVGQGCTFVMSRALFDAARTFVIAYPEHVAALHYHDWLVYALARSFGYKWVFDRIPRMLYRQHSHNDTGAQTTAHGIARRIQLIRSGWYSRQVSAMVAVCLVANRSTRAANRVQSMMNAVVTSPYRRRIQWSSFLLTSSRRRLRDRLILSFAALFGYL